MPNRLTAFDNGHLVSDEPVIGFVRGVEIWLSRDLDTDKLTQEFRIPHPDLEGCSDHKHRRAIERMFANAEGAFKRIEVFPYLIIGIYKAKVNLMAVIVPIDRC